jgi:hypothetical protein
MLESGVHCTLQLLLDGGVAAFAVICVLGTNEIRAASSDEGGRCPAGHENTPKSHQLSKGGLQMKKEGADAC